MNKELKNKLIEISNGVNEVVSTALHDGLLAMAREVAANNKINIPESGGGVSTSQLVTLYELMFSKYTANMFIEMYALSGAMDEEDITPALSNIMLNTFQSMCESVIESTIGFGPVVDAMERVEMHRIEVQEGEEEPSEESIKLCDNPECTACALKKRLMTRGVLNRKTKRELTDFMENILREKLTEDVNNLEGDEQSEAVKRLIEFNQIAAKNKGGSIH